ncbi:hypothetical protein P053_00671 [Brucella abortus 01-4165]|nr:hypothetical protein DK48_1172 [Brucella abortus]AIJ61108.1 hypothetical protein DK53_930 [Brucella abortus bv. 9 str. C68]AIJ63140.1 hypothetical protein DO74_943 [Brucella abortus bv. 6 str. 870]AIJ91824.1 hypothetical protein DK55_946 [Brucella abortus bv. 2 str. 86/8/59]EHR12225.1 hypothetical protein M19_01210 [Brucella abortus bv. 1 str. NI474]EHR14059.1 hypothetical protein M17_00639 [Brucella abortus bv. 1 str. NI435a]EHR14367.1 hypothetical protein M1A_00641 [Brucella abortus bv. 
MNGVAACKNFFFPVFIFRLNCQRLAPVNLARTRIRLGLAEGNLHTLGLLIPFDKGFEVRFPSFFRIITIGARIFLMASSLRRALRDQPSVRFWLVHFWPQAPWAYPAPAQRMQPEKSRKQPVPEVLSDHSTSAFPYPGTIRLQGTRTALLIWCLAAKMLQH